MIIIIAGGIGSGKTLTAVKELVDRKQKAFTNFKLNDAPYTRLKYEHLFKQVEEEQGKKTIKKMKLNFTFWSEQTKKGGFDIYLDEFHNVMSSRRSMSKRNVLLSDWLSQVRKILGQAETNNLYLITQKVRRIDVTSRDLAHGCILCRKQTMDAFKIPTIVNERGKLVKKMLPLTLVYRHYFPDTDALDAYERYGVNTCKGVDYFVGNPYFKYYNSYELIDFGTEEYV